MPIDHLGFSFQFNANMEKSNKNPKFQTIKIHDLYVSDLASGVRNNVPTFLTFVPPGVIEDNKKSTIYHIDPCDDFPNGTIECFIEVELLKKYLRFELDSELVAALNKVKMVTVGSNYSCSFLTHPLET